MSPRGLLLGSIIVGTLISSTAMTGEIDSFTEWAQAHGTQPSDGQEATVFGTVTNSFPSNNLSPMALAYDAVEHAFWLANEDGGELLLIDAAPPHGVIRSINIRDFNLTTDGNQNGVAVVGDDLYVTDFQGDQYLSDDLIYQLDRASGALVGSWHVDGVLNPNPDANINMILGISTDGTGNLWVTDNEANLHNITLLPGGNWVQNSVQTVPGGGSWAGIDYDTCLEEYFTANFANGVFSYHTSMPAAPTISAPAAGPNVTGITSNNDGVIWTVGFADGVIYQHEGIGCVVPVETTTWGSIKGSYR